MSIDRLVTGDNFELAYINADNETRKRIEEAIEREDKLTLKSLIKKEVDKLTPFYKMNMAKLRGIGRNLRIPDYHRLNKIYLIEEIENVVQRLKEGSKRGSV
jgi:predicted NBD/HSP70 family sugar kinase